MRIKKRLRLGTVTIGETERKYINEVLDSTYVAPGRWTRQFEETMAKAHGKQYAIALNSGQSALMVALKAAHMLYGIFDVAVPAVTYISSLAAVYNAGLCPTLVDVSRDADCQIMWGQINADKTDAVMPVHLFGRATDRPIPRMEKKFLVEDACESIYADGIGFGNALCLSFYSSHTITAGYGGMILTDDKDFYFKCWQLVNHGRKDWDDYSSCHNLKERFIFSDIGYSLKFSDLNAALGLAQHERKDDILASRRANAEYIRENISDIDDLILPSLDGHTFMMFPLVVRSERRDALIKTLNDDDIETRMLMPITNQPVVREIMGKDVEDHYPNAKFINNHGFYLPSHQDLGLEDLDRIIKIIRDFYKK